VWSSWLWPASYVPKNLWSSKNFKSFGYASKKKAGFKRRSLASRLLRKMSYQERGGMQILGPGILIKNYEVTIPFIQNQMGTFTLDAMFGDQWQKDFSCFTYFKVIAFAVIQQRINNPNSAGTVSVLFNFNRSIDGDITTNDATKILPPFGGRSIVYKPGSGIVYVTRTMADDTSNRPLNLSVFNATTNVLIDGIYHLPGQLAGYSTASTSRFARCVLRVAFKGSFEKVEGTSKQQVDIKEKIHNMVKNGVVFKEQVPKKSLILKEIESRFEKAED
jgi:hypothetical protein